MCDPGAVTKDSRNPRETKFGFTVGDTVWVIGTDLKGRVTGFDEKYVRCDMGRGRDDEGWDASSLRHVPKETKFGFTVGDAVSVVGTDLEARVIGFTDDGVKCHDGTVWRSWSLRHVPLAAQPATGAPARSSEQTMVDMIREDLGVTIDPQAWRMFVRSRFGRLSPLAHRIHEGRS